MEDRVIYEILTKGKVNDFGKALKETDFQGVFSFETVPPAEMPIPEAEKKYADLIRIAEQIIGVESK